MKILHVNTHDIKGPAALSAYKLHQALVKNDIHSQMLVLSKLSNDPTVTGKYSKLHYAVTNLRKALEDHSLQDYPERSRTDFTTALVPFSGIVNKINSLKPDIVHLHCLKGGLMRIKDLKKIKASVVWSLHDMWAFTGGCHYDEYCEAYKDNCGNCKVLKSSESNDLSRKVYNTKLMTYEALSRLTVAGTSKWLTKCAKESSLLKEKEIIYLPPPVDTETFSPLNSMEAKEILDLPQDKKLVVYNAKEAENNPIKGLKQLQEAFQNLSLKNVDLVVVGNLEQDNHHKFGVNIHYIGSVEDDVSLKLIYAAADLMVYPSLQETAPNTVLESMACGTPVVGFDMGANPEVITHQVDGYLAILNDPAELAKGIEWILNHNDYESLSQNARKKITSTYDVKLVIRKHINLYNEILALPSIPIKDHLEAIFSGK